MHIYNYERNNLRTPSTDFRRASASSLGEKYGGETRVAIVEVFVSFSLTHSKLVCSALTMVKFIA